LWWNASQNLRFGWLIRVVYFKGPALKVNPRDVLLNTSAWLEEDENRREGFTTVPKHTGSHYLGWWEGLLQTGADSATSLA